jgi:hypothetical protein
VINSALNVTGTGGLNLKFDQADGFVGLYFVNAQVNLAATTTFTTQAGTFLPADTYTVLVDQAGLMGMTTNDNAVRYVLGNNVTASGAWTPIGPDGANPFMGVFDGLGHVVNNITVSGTTDYHGMFGMIGVPAYVQNIGVTNVNVSGTRYVGALVGANLGAVYHSYASGTVTASTATGTPITAVGGLVGQNDGVIDGSRSTVNVTATSDTSSGPANIYVGGMTDGGIGGLAGISTSSVNNSFATGSVSGLRDVGGLIGWATMNVSASYATGAVTLAGNGTDRINVGGLIGHGNAMLGAATSFWDTTTTGKTTSFDGANFVTTDGMNTANMQTAANFTSATAANGNANPSWDTAVWTLSNGSYPSLMFANSGLATAVTLTVVATSKVYGDGNPALPGLTLSGCTDCISLTGWGGALTTTTDVGSYAYSLTDLLVLSYASGTSVSDYTITWADPTTYKFTITQRPVTLTASKTYDGTNDLTGKVTIGNMVGTQTLTYTGATVSDAHVATASKYISAITLANGSNGGVASNYQLPAFAYDATNNAVTIDAKQLTATASITAAAKVYDGLLAATGSTVTGDLTGELNGDSITLDISGLSLAFNDAHVATASTISASGNVALGALTAGGSGSKDGTTGNAVAGLLTDYILAGQPTIASVAGTISAKQLTATASINAVAKTYDGLLAATGSTVTGDLTGELNSDSITLDISGLSLAFNDAHVATAGKTISASGSVALGTLTAGGSGSKDGSTGNAVAGALGDYVLASQPTISAVAGTITAKALAVTAPTINAVSKTYDGLLAASTSSLTGGGVTGFVGNDSGSLNTAGVALAYSDAHVVGSKTIDASGAVTLNFAGAAKGSGNGSSVNNEVAGATTDYSFAAPTIASVAGTIAAKQLTATASIAAVAKTYDATLAATGSTVTGDLTGEINGDIITLDTSGLTLAFSDANVLTLNKTIGASGNVALGTLTAGGIGSKNGSTGNETAGQLTDYIIAAQPTIAAVFGSITPKALDVLGLSAPHVNPGATTTAFFSGTPTLKTPALAAGAGTASDGTPYAVDANAATPLTVVGTNLTGTIASPSSTDGATVAVQVNGLTLAGTGKDNYTLTGTSVSGTIKASLPPQDTIVPKVETVYQTVAEALAAAKNSLNREIADNARKAEATKDRYVASQRQDDNSMARVIAQELISDSCPQCRFSTADYEAWLGGQQQTAQGGGQDSGGQQKPVPTVVVPEVKPIQAKLSGSVTYEDAPDSGTQSGGQQSGSIATSTSVSSTPTQTPPPPTGDEAPSAQATKVPRLKVSAETNLPAGTEVTVSFTDANGNTKTTTAKVGEDGNVKTDGVYPDLKLPVTATLTSETPKYEGEPITLGTAPAAEDKAAADKAAADKKAADKKAAEDKAAADKEAADKAAAATSPNPPVSKPVEIKLAGSSSYTGDAYVAKNTYKVSAQTNLAPGTKVTVTFTAPGGNPRSIEAEVGSDGTVNTSLADSPELQVNVTISSENPKFQSETMSITGGTCSYCA